jgi:hypothetical protein
MQRRTFVSLSATAGLTGAAQASSSKSALFHLRYFYMRQGTQSGRTQKYLSDVWMPAAKRAGIGPMGFFSPMFGERSPYILTVVSYPSFAALEAVANQFADDKEFAKASEEYNSIQDPPYVRLESELLRALDGSPTLDVPPTDPQRAARIFEMRTYESLNEVTVQRKAKMFDDGEAGIFRRLGMSPVFFGVAVFGKNMPKLSYMLSYDDMAAREKLWRAFGSDPEWKKLRAQPGLSDAEIVSNISNPILRPLSFSPIR